MATEEGKASASQPGVRNDPFPSYNFKLDLGSGGEKGSNGETLFYECSGIAAKVEAIRWRSGGNNQVVHRLPGRTEYADIRLSSGVTRSTEMWDWFMSAMLGKPQRRNCSVILLDYDGATEAMRWNLAQAWVSEICARPMHAMSNEIAIHEVVLVFETLTRA